MHVITLLKLLALSMSRCFSKKKIKLLPEKYNNPRVTKAIKKASKKTKNRYCTKNQTHSIIEKKTYK